MKIQLLGLPQGTLDMMSTKSLKYPSRFPEATQKRDPESGMCPKQTKQLFLKLAETTRKMDENGTVHPETLLYQSQMLHGAGIFTNIDPINHPVL